MDRLTKEQRSENMRRIRSKNTKPEFKVRELVRSLGHTGYRLHRKELSGKPDLAWIGKKTALFVHGCFWHGHTCAEGLRIPKSNADYWVAKISRNRERDLVHQQSLLDSGWRFKVIWECELRSSEKVLASIEEFLASMK